MNATNLIYAALRLNGVIRAGQTPASTENSDSLNALNVLVENWSTERLNIYSLAIASYSLVAGQAVYTIGPGGNFNTARPVKIESAGVLVPNTGGTGTIRFGLELYSETQFQAIAEKGASSDVAQCFYCDYAFPLANVYLWPTPSSASGYQVELGTWRQLASFPDLVTDVPLATGYSRALEYALAVETSSIFGVSVPASVAQIAAESKAAIRALNGAMGITEPVSAPVNATPQGGN